MVARHRRGRTARPELAGSLAADLDQRKLLARRIEELLETHPLSKVLTSMPGIGVRAGARILIEVGDGSTFPTAGHLATHAGLAPATRGSGSSIVGEEPSRRGNKRLKRALSGAAPVHLGQRDRSPVPGVRRTGGSPCGRRGRFVRAEPTGGAIRRGGPCAVTPGVAPWQEGSYRRRCGRAPGVRRTAPAVRGRARRRGPG